MLRIVSLLLIGMLCTCVHAQKLEGTWKLIARKGNTPCAVDALVTFGADGQSAQITTGSQFAGCTPSTEAFDGWSVGKEEVRLQTGGKKNMKVINFREGSTDGAVQWIIIAYEKDYMRLQAGADLGSEGERPAHLIFKRLE